MPCVTCHAFPTTSHEAGSLKSKSKILIDSNPTAGVACDGAIAFEDEESLGVEVEGSSLSPFAWTICGALGRRGERGLPSALA